MSNLKLNEFIDKDITSELCNKCKKRPATESWVGDGGMIGFVHGCFERWCKRCCIEEQLSHCKKAAKRIPALEKELLELKS